MSEQRGRDMWKSMRLRTRWVARLEEQRVQEQVEEDRVAARATTRNVSEALHEFRDMMTYLGLTGASGAKPH